MSHCRLVLLADAGQGPREKVELPATPAPQLHQEGARRGKEGTATAAAAAAFNVVQNTFNGKLHKNSLKMLTF